jgi:proline iminopeptidase
MEDATLPAIEMNGLFFHAETRGDPANPVIVVLHGGPGGDYRSLLKLSERFDGVSLADDYYMVYWDQRGSGLSQRVDGALITEETYLSDLHTLVHRYSPDRPVYLIGESWGGQYGIDYINHYPEDVAGAVFIEPGPMDGETMERIKDDMYDIDLEAEWLNDLAWANQFFTPDDHVRMDFERMLGLKDSQPRFHQDMEHPAPAWRLGAVANRYVMEDGQDDDGIFVYDFAGNLQAYTTPVLLVAGSLSEVLGPSLQEEQVKRFPHATLQVVEGAGHDVAWVRTAEVLTHIRSYLAERQGGAQ